MKQSRIICLLAALLLAMSLIVSAGAETATEIAVHQYTDETDGTTFNLPDGWTEDVVEGEDYKGVSSVIDDDSKERRIVFVHICLDDWDAAGKQFADSRKAYDEMMNNKETISMSLNNAEIEEVEFNGIAFFRYQSDVSRWQYFRYNNAYVHLFQITIDTDDPYFPYFEAIMNSVVFPEY